MHLNILPTTSDAIAACTAHLAQQLTSKPNSILGLATGGTMEPVYADLVAQHKQGKISFAASTTFNLDEYIGISANDPQSYASYMAHHLFDHIDILPEAHFLPDGANTDSAFAAQRYETLIEAKGPIDLQLLGLGPNGHIGFNEPGSDFASATRPVDLTASTIAVNARFFEPAEFQPHRAITMGIGTILRARSVALLAIGAAKAEAARAMIEGPTSQACPASALHTHEDVHIFLDADAASLLTAKPTETRNLA